METKNIDSSLLDAAEYHLRMIKIAEEAINYSYNYTDENDVRRKRFDRSISHHLDQLSLLLKNDYRSSSAQNEPGKEG